MSDNDAPDERNVGTIPTASQAGRWATGSGHQPEAIGPPHPDQSRVRPSKGRWGAAIILLVIGCVLVPLSLVATWTRDTMLDTDQYVATVAPLTANPAIQDAVASVVTTRVFSATNIQSSIQNALPSQAAFLAAPLTGQVKSFTHDAVRAIVASPRFQSMWEHANRLAHGAVVRLLTGGTGRAITVSQGTVILDLSPLIAKVKARLDEAGLARLSSAVSAVDGQITIYHSDRLAKAGDVVTRVRQAVDALQQWAAVLPLLALAALGAAVVIAPTRQAAVLWAGLGVALAMVILALGLVIVRSTYLDATAAVVPHDAAAAIFDTVVQFLRDGLRALLVLGLVVAAGAALAGPSRSAVRLRTWVRHIGDESAGSEWASGRTPQWIARHRQGLDVSIVALGAFVLVWWDHPTASVIIFLSALVLAGVVCIEVLSRAGQVAAAH